MSDAPRISPHRRATKSQSGRIRIALLPRSPVRDAVDPEKPLRLASEPRRWLMAIGYTDRGAVTAAFQQAIAAAALLADAQTGVIGLSLGPFDADSSALGVDALCVLPTLTSAHFAPDQHLEAICKQLDKFDPINVFLSESPLGDSDLGRRLIASMDSDGATRVVELAAAGISVRSSDGATIYSRSLPKIIIMEPGIVDPDLPFRGQGRDVAAIADGSTATSIYKDLGIETGTGQLLALEDAETIVSAGRGVSDIGKISTLADALGAAVGASRVAVDEGRYARDQQIGASGKTVSAITYVAVGISGAVQHLQGIKDCRHVIAINTDAGAPITKRADLTIIGDASDVMDALTKRIREARAQQPDPEAP